MDYRILPVMRFISSVVLGVLLLGCSFGQSKPYPQPQTPSATGQPAPDFNLKDANGNSFTLSGQHGSWVLLYFYRGYW
jgi:cytochrome oxidase Cu insertion factor (SCO1/SenC/PrrC family)